MSLLLFRSNTDLAALYIVFKGSAANETKNIAGISHLMEHLQCKNVDHLLPQFTRDNINHNAYTANDHITFYISGLEKYLNKYRREFVEKIVEFQITEEILEKEKNIVLQEYLNYFADQTYCHSLNLQRKEYGFYDALGLKSAITNITLDDCKKWHKEQFASPDLIISYSSDFVPYSDYVDKNILTKTQRKPQRNLIPDSSEFEIIANFDKTSSVIFYKLIESKDAKIIKFINSVLGKGLESPLYELREKQGLVYAISCRSDYIDEDKFVLNITAETASENVITLENSLKEILNRDLTADRFEDVRCSKMAEIECQQAINFGDYHRYVFPERYLDLSFLQSLTLDEVNNVYQKYFKDFKMSVADESWSEFKGI